MLSTLTIHGFKKSLAGTTTKQEAASGVAAGESPALFSRAPTGNFDEKDSTIGKDFKSTHARLGGGGTTQIGGGGLTQNSFYNSSAHQQKLQEQMQMEELQKQLVRIFGYDTVVNPTFDLG